MCRVQREKTWHSGRRRCILWPCQGQNGNPGYYYFRQRLFALRQGRWKLHLFKRELGPKGKPGPPVRCKEPELYDLSDDPAEKVNLAQNHPDLVAELAGRAREFHAGIEPVMKLPGPGRSVAAGIITQAPKSPHKVLK